MADADSLGEAGCLSCEGCGKGAWADIAVVTGSESAVPVAVAAAPAVLLLLQLQACRGGNSALCDTRRLLLSLLPLPSSLSHTGWSSGQALTTREVEKQTPMTGSGPHAPVERHKERRRVL